MVYSDDSSQNRNFKRKGDEVVPFDYSKLRGRIREVFGTEGAFAKAIGRSHNFMSSVFSGNSVLSQDDIVNAVKELGMSVDDIGVYFFTPKVHKSETK